MTDRPFGSDEISISRNVSLIETLEKSGCVSEESYYESLPQQTRKELEDRAQVLAQQPEDEIDRDFRLKRELERKLIEAREGFLVIVLAGEYHQPSILDILKYKGYTPRIISATTTLANEQKLLPTVETNYLKYQIIKARKIKETRDFLVNADLLSKSFGKFSPKTKPDVAAIFIGDQHGVDYEFSLPSAVELQQAGVRSVFFYGEHGDQDHFSTVDSLIAANLGKGEWPGYRRLGQHLKNYQEGGLNVDILGFEVETPQK